MKELLRDYLSRTMPPPMDTLLGAWHWIAQHWQEIVLALVFALVFELLSLGSRLRSAVRHVKNKLAERSVARLQKRIAELTNYRDALSEIATSEAARMLYAFQITILMLFSICLARASLAVAHLHIVTDWPLPSRWFSRWHSAVNSAYDFMALTSLGLAMLLGLAGMRMTSIRYRWKISTVIKQVEVEIAELQKKLNFRLESP